MWGWINLEQMLTIVGNTGLEQRPSTHHPKVRRYLKGFCQKILGNCVIHRLFDSEFKSMQPVNEISQIIQSDKLLVKMPPIPALKQELRWYSKYFSDHLLHYSAKWTNELLMGITPESEIDTVFLLKTFITNYTAPKGTFQQPEPIQEEGTEDVLNLVKTLFNLREYKKCSYVLEPFMKNRPSHSVIFFYYYSKWMSYQIRKEEEIYENEGQPRTQVNPEITLLGSKFKEMYEKGQLRDITLYLYGLILKEQEQIEEAREVFMKCLNSFPCFWSCWVQLSKIIIDDQDVNNVIKEIKDHWMKNFFFSNICLEKFKGTYSTEINYGLFCFFKNSTYLMNQIAHCFYNNQEFDISLEWFQKLTEVDPYNVENMDTYSNILYIKEKQGELANLAMRCFYNNKYCAETCCIVGNYYSLIGEHHKAIANFRKALKMDKSCLGAWTLMGHECLELKNIAGAIEAYRSAVEIDSRDFRAWYGLGQTYELQKMNNYALYYFTKAVMARPKDARMWNAMASCYESMDRRIEAGKCYQRAENCRDREGIAIHHLAKLYSLMGPQFQSKAVQAFEMNLKRKDEENVADKEAGQCLLFLTKYYMRANNLGKAAQYASRLHDFESSERDEVNAILQQFKEFKG